MDPSVYATLASLLGALIVLWTMGSVIEMLLLPRTPGWSNPSTWVESLIFGAFRLVQRRLGNAAAVDRWMSWQGPLAVFLVLGTWLVLLVVGYALLLTPWVDSWPRAVREAGSSMLTLGFSDTPEALPTALDFLSAACGFGVMTLHIAYLPTLYSAYSRREREVALLASRAGKPAWGPHVVANACAVEGADALPGLYSRWELWSADVAESHASYRVLAGFRSPDPDRDWVRSLEAVLDAAGFDVALGLTDGAGAARMLRETGTRCLQTVARCVRVSPTAAEQGPLLQSKQAQDALDLLRAAGVEVDCDAEQLLEELRAWRACYAPWAAALARVVGSPASRWWAAPEPAARGEDEPASATMPPT